MDCYIEAKIGGENIYVPVSEKLGNLILKTFRRLNYKRYIALMRKSNIGEIASNFVVMDSDFIFSLEDTFENEGYDNAFHKQFERFEIGIRKVLYEIFREDCTLRFLSKQTNFSQIKIEEAIRLFFHNLSEEVK